MAKLIEISSGKETLLTIGKHTLGRGPLLKITDKRVSRNHALIVIEEESVKIFPKHKNPCFVKRATADVYVAIEKDDFMVLESGDYLSLLPEQLIYQVKFESHSRPCLSSPLTLDSYQATVPASSFLPSSPPSNGTVDPSPQPSCSRVCPVTISVAELNRGASMGRRRILPSWLVAVNSSSISNTRRKTPSKRSSPSTRETSSTSPARKKPTNISLISSKQTVSTDDPETAVAKADDPKDSYVVAESLEKSRDTDNGGDVNSQRCEKAEKKLSQCPYGKRCYRKNPLHFKEYCHDEDEEKEESDDRPECPYGTDCYRKNLLHKKQFKHTTSPGKQQQQQQQQPDKRAQRTCRNKKKRSVVAGDSDDDGEQNTYDYNDSFIDDQEMSEGSSSYGDDSEDENWSPGAEDDVKELLEDAKTFINNTK